MFKRSRNPIAQLTIIWILCLISSCSNSNDSSEFSLQKYTGKWFILNYWAEWCTPCIKEIPELNELSARYPDKIAVAAVNFDRLQSDELFTASRRVGINYEILEGDPADQLRLSVPASLPTTYIYNPQGALIAKLVGPQTAESLLSKTNLR